MARPLTCYGTFGINGYSPQSRPDSGKGYSPRQGYPLRVGQLKEAGGKPLTVADRNFIQGI